VHQCEEEEELSWGKPKDRRCYLERGTGRAVKTAKADRGAQDDQRKKSETWEEVKDQGRKHDREAPSRAEREPTVAIEEQVTGSRYKVN